MGVGGRERMKRRSGGQEDEKGKDREEEVEEVKEVLLLVGAHTRQGHDRAISWSTLHSTHPTC